MNANVGNRVQPRPDFAVGDRDVNENGTQACCKRPIERIAQVSMETLNFSFGLRSIWSAEFDSDAVVTHEIVKEWMKAMP